MSEPFKLFQLQQIDSKIDQILKRKAEINLALANNQKVAAAQKKSGAAKKLLELTSSALKSAENAVNDQKIKIDQNQAALYGGKVTSPKELQDLQAESVSLKNYLETLEERQLEAMMDHEEKETAFKEAEKTLSDTQMEAAAENKDLSVELQNLEESFNNKAEEKDNLSPQIPKEDMDIYLKVRKKRAGIAVSRLTGTNCSSCGATLPRALAQAAKSPTKISFCTTCGRILYGN